MKKKLFALLMSSALGVTLLTGCPAKQNPEPGPKEDVTVVDDFYPEESDKPIEDLDNTPMSEVPQDLIDDLEEATGDYVDVSVIIEAGLSEEQLRTLIHLMNLVKDGDAFESKQILTDALYDILALIKSMTPDQIRFIQRELGFVDGQTTIEDMFSYRVRGTSLLGVNRYKEIAKLSNDQGFQSTVDKYAQAFTNIQYTEKQQKAVDYDNATGRALEIIFDYIADLEPEKKSTLINAIHSLVDYNIDIVFDAYQKQQAKYEGYEIDGDLRAEYQDANGRNHSSYYQEKSILSFLTVLSDLDPVDEIKMGVALAAGNEESAAMAKDLVEKAVLPAISLKLDITQDDATKAQRQEIIQQLSSLDTKDYRNIGALVYRLADKLKGHDVAHMTEEEWVELAPAIKEVTEGFTSEQKQSIQKLGNIFDIDVFRTILLLTTKLTAYKEASSKEAKDAIKKEIKDVIDDVSDKFENNFHKYFRDGGDIEVSKYPEIEKLNDDEEVQYCVKLYSFNEEAYQNEELRKEDLEFTILKDDQWRYQISYERVMEYFPQLEVTYSFDTSKLGFMEEKVTLTLRDGDEVLTDDGFYTAIVEPTDEYLGSKLYRFSSEYESSSFLVKYNSYAYEPITYRNQLDTSTKGWNLYRYEREGELDTYYPYFVYEYNGDPRISENIGLAFVGDPYFNRSAYIYEYYEIDTTAFVYEISESFYYYGDIDTASKGKKSAEYNGHTFHYEVIEKSDGDLQRTKLYVGKIEAGTLLQSVEGTVDKQYTYELSDGYKYSYTDSKSYTFTNVTLNGETLTLTYEGQQYSFYFAAEH